MPEKRDIEEILFWALNEQGLGWVSAGGGDSLSMLAELGVRVDRSPGLAAPGIGRNTDPAAGIVRDAVDKLPPEAGALVLLNCRIGMRPDWGKEGFGLAAQKLNKRDQPMWIYRDQENRRGKIGPVRDWSAYARHVERVRYERAQWATFHEALCILRVKLSTELASITPTGPRIAPQPWVGMGDEGPEELPTGFSMDDIRQAAEQHNQYPSHYEPRAHVDETADAK